MPIKSNLRRSQTIYIFNVIKILFVLFLQHKDMCHCFKYEKGECHVDLLFQPFSNVCIGEEMPSRHKLMI